MNKAYEKIRKAEADLEQLKVEFLRACGWTYTSRTPGSHWLWFKTFRVYKSYSPKWETESVTVSGSADDAIRYELSYIEPKDGE